LYLSLHRQTSVPHTVESRAVTISIHTGFRCASEERGHAGHAWGLPASTIRCAQLALANPVELGANLPCSCGERAFARATLSLRFGRAGRVYPFSDEAFKL
jgi:hypothetical protein